MSDVTAPKIDTTEYLQKLVKLIPAEIIALYLTIAAFVPKEAVVQFIVAGICFVLTPVYLIQVSKIKSVLQTVMSTIAFAVWVFATGGPFATLAWYQAWMPGSLLVLFTLVAPMFFPTVAPAAGTASRVKGWREV